MTSQEMINNADAVEMQKSFVSQLKYIVDSNEDLERDVQSRLG